MMATVCKIVDFPAAHANLHHKGQCNNIHGHTWTLEIHCHGPVAMTAADQEKENFGMVCDFKTIKAAYEKFVEPFVEHQNLNETLSHLEEYTTEIIAGWIYNELKPHIPYLSKIRLWEGKSSFAEVSNGDMMR